MTSWASVLPTSQHDRNRSLPQRVGNRPTALNTSFPAGSSGVFSVLLRSLAIVTQTPCMSLFTSSANVVGWYWVALAALLAPSVAFGFTSTKALVLDASLGGQISSGTVDAVHVLEIASGR